MALVSNLCHRPCWHLRGGKNAPQLPLDELESLSCSQRRWKWRHLGCLWNLSRRAASAWGSFQLWAELDARRFMRGTEILNLLTKKGHVVCWQSLKKSSRIKTLLLQQMLQETKYTAVMQLWQKSHSGWSVFTKHIRFLTGPVFNHASTSVPHKHTTRKESALLKHRILFFIWHTCQVASHRTKKAIKRWESETGACTHHIWLAFSTLLAASFNFPTKSWKEANTDAGIKKNTAK